MIDVGHDMSFQRADLQQQPDREMKYFLKKKKVFKKIVIDFSYFVFRLKVRFDKDFALFCSVLDIFFFFLVFVFYTCFL